MQVRTLGLTGPRVSAIGLGAMVFSPGMYGVVDDASALATIDHALGAGINFIDTADAYGADGHNERLMGRALAGRRREVVVATKFGLLPAPDGQPGRPIPVSYDFGTLNVNGRPEHVQFYAEQSLQRLGIDEIDVYYLHFPDPGVPIEETVGAMAALVKAGKVHHLGLCNVTAEQVRRAHAVHPLAAVQNEYSLWAREAERELLPTLRELGIAFVPWGPLGTGFLTGTVQKLEQGDFRNMAPRFKGDNLQQNAHRFGPILAFAERLGVSPAQLALAWILHQYQYAVPIPGTRKAAHLDTNAAAADIHLDADHLAELDRLARSDLAVGRTLL